ncbi:MAG TPA: inovirus-type Gp2 protein [Pseudomonadales bacterium]|nr:inovirus-type Gp2 protein [Pseudomonadales bacterium]
MYKRLKENKNLILYYGREYRNLPILDQCNPFIEPYLATSYRVLHSALAAHSTISAFRFDLHYPRTPEYINPDWIHTNAPILSFFDSLKQQIQWDRHIKQKYFGRVHPTTVHYIWCREKNAGTVLPHYHGMILLNKQAYHQLGNWKSDHPNLANRMITAWQRATCLPLDTAQNLVQFSHGETVHYASRDELYSVGRVFERMSYLCKAYSKQYVNGLHMFGNNRK